MPKHFDAICFGGSPRDLDHALQGGIAIFFLTSIAKTFIYESHCDLTIADLRLGRVNRMKNATKKAAPKKAAKKAAAKKKK
jgi:hypothetical protein